MRITSVYPSGDKGRSGFAAKAASGTRWSLIIAVVRLLFMELTAASPAATTMSKPSTKSAPSSYAVIGRYILSKKIFHYLKNQKKGKGGEIHITDTIQSLINEKEKFIGHSFSGKYLDCGTMNGYINSSKEISKL